MPNYKKNGFKKKILLIAVPILILAGISGYGALMYAAGATPVSKKSADQDGINQLFKSFGVIRLAGIAPPVEINLKTINGEMVNVSDFKGKIVFLNFWTTWCPDCRIEMPEMEKLHKRFKEDEFVMVAINLRESKKKVRTFIKKYKLTFLTLLDSNGRVGTSFGIRSIPTTFILDKNGGLMGKVMGPRTWSSKSAIRLFETLVHGKKAAVV